MPVQTKAKTPDIRIPPRFRQLQSLPGDPADSVSYEYASEGAECFVTVSPVPKYQVMPFHDPQAVIDGIHRSLSEDQGLIEVGCGVTGSRRKYIYSVIKTLRRRKGVRYTLTMHVEENGSAAQIRGYFSETSVTGARDALVFALLEQQGEVRLTGQGLEGWVADPYDPFFGFGTRMNLSEQQRFDSLFPDHPLSVLRAFVREVIPEN